MERILIVVDMQNDFVDGALGTKEAASIVDSVVSKIERFDGRLIATLDTHGHDYLETAEGKKLPVAHCIKGTAGWELHEKVQQALAGKNYKTVEKGTFGSVRLAQELSKEWEEEPFEAELIGLCTDICVVSNALLLKAHIPQMRIFVDASCCAGVTPKTHQAALETMKMCQIDVTEDSI
ncbi:MAG: cysteine hydrolase [Eubacterium sp.]|nr:cysteine hydrolase [Eubacterium sp.]